MLAKSRNGSRAFSISGGRALSAIGAQNNSREGRSPLAQVKSNTGGGSFDILAQSENNEGFGDKLQLVMESLPERHKLSNISTKMGNSVSLDEEM